MRKTSSYLNHLRSDVQEALNMIDVIGSNLDAGCHDLARCLVHDLKVDPATIDECIKDIKTDQAELTNQLKRLKEARVKYLEFV